MIPWAKPKIFGNEIKFITEALDSTYISGGHFLDKCEEKLSKMHGGTCLCVANGTVSLQLALQTLGIGAGDEVLVPGWCFAAAANMVITCGATPVYVDINRNTWLMDAARIEELITPRTKAIIPVHTYGNVCDMPTIKRIADRHGLFVIEDCAESIFSTVDGKLCGRFSDIASYSFQATKTITCGEGGMVLLNNEWIEKAKLIRSHGMDRSYRHYWHHLLGFNYRLTNIQAAMLYAQLEHIEEVIKERDRVYLRYRRNLKSIKGCSIQSIDSNVVPVIWTLGVQLWTSTWRDKIIDILKNKRVETRPGFYPFSEQPLYQTRTLPNASYIAGRVICLPFYIDLTNKEIDGICQKFNETLRGNGY